MDHGVAPNPGQTGIDLYNDPFGLFKKSSLKDQTQGHAEIAVLVHGRHCGDEHVVPIDLDPAGDAVVQVVAVG